MIDFHTHPFLVKEFIEDDPALLNCIRNVFGLYFPPQPLKVFLRELDAAGVDKAVLLPLDCSISHGCKIFSNEQIAKLVSWSPRFIGFSSVDPLNKNASKELEYAVNSLGLKGLKLDPSIQRFEPNSKDYAYPLYYKCRELKIPVMIHCGLSWAPKGKTSYSHPLQLEDVFNDFPEVTFIIPHFGWPWVRESIMLALKHPNVYLDTSIIYSGTPKTVFEQVFTYDVGFNVLEASLSSQILFGSNYPRQDIRRTVKGIKSLNMSKEFYINIFNNNSEKILAKGKLIQ